jgi:hypothetical protein
MNPSLYHKFLDIYIIPAGLNPTKTNKPWKTSNPLGSIQGAGVQLKITRQGFASVIRGRMLSVKLPTLSHTLLICPERKILMAGCCWLFVTGLFREKSTAVWWLNKPSEQGNIMSFRLNIFKVARRGWFTSYTLPTKNSKSNVEHKHRFCNRT